MIVISLVLVIAAAVSLFIGLFVVTETLTFIWGAIVLCLVSLLLLWLGTRQRKGAGPTEPSAPVYGGAARAGGSTAPARTAAGDDLDELTSPDGGTVVRKTTARDRAATRVAADSGDASAPAVEETPVEAATADATGDTEDVSTDTATTAAAATPAKKAVAKKAVARKKSTKKAAAKKSTKKAAAKKSSKKTAARKSTKKTAARKSTKKTAAKKSTKKASARKSTKKATAGTSGAEARARLAQIAGVGPAKQDALLSQFGSLEGIRDASVDDIGNVRGFGEALATRVKKELS